MTEPTPDQTAISTAQALTDALTAMSDRLAAVNARQTRQRHVIVGLAVSLLIDVALTVVVALVATAAHDASDASNRNGATIAQLHASQVSGCRAGNQTRAQERQLWHHLASLSSPVTSAQKQQDRQLLAYIDKTFAARNCMAAYPLNGGH